MGPETILEALAVMSPIVWLCVGAVVLAAVVIRALVLTD